MSNFTQDQIEEINQMIDKAIDKNSDSGSPFVAPHEHNGNDGFNINPLNLIGFTPIPISRQQYTDDGGATYSLGYGANLEGGDSAAGGHPSQYITNPSIATFPIPVIQGNGVGVQSAFNGGWAPEGSMILFANGSLLSFLYIRSGGTWYGINLTATPITP